MTLPPTSASQFLDVAQLDGLALNWAVAKHDPRCKGLTFTVVQGVLCGVSRDEDTGELAVCIYLHGSGFRAQTEAERLLGTRRRHAQCYCPVDFWPHAGHLLEAGRLEVGPDGETAWRAKAGDLELRGQSSARLALLRAFVMRYEGLRVELPSDLAALLLADC